MKNFKRYVIDFIKGVRHFLFLRWLYPLFDIIRIKKEIRQRYKNNNLPIRVLFMVHFSPAWNKLEPIYKKMVIDDRFEPILLCVPGNVFATRTNDDNAIYDYITRCGYSNAINAITKEGKWIDIKTLKPDFVFQSRPYNSYMYDEYKSDKIRKYALLCNTLYGATFTKKLQKICLNLNYYKDVFIYFSFDKNEQKFYKKRFFVGNLLGIQKCLPYGAIGVECAYSREKQFRTDRKIVMWTPRWSVDSERGGSNWFNYREIIFKLAEENSDVDFIIRPHPLMFANFKETGLMTEKEIKDIVQYISESNNIILDESADYIDTFWKVDLLITDGSGMVPEFFITTKPIIYCNSHLKNKGTVWANKMISSLYEVNNEEELIHYFNMLKNKDPKMEKRVKVINEIFGDARNASDKILDTLYHVVRKV